MAAKLAVGYTLDELMNDITGGVLRPPSSRPSTTWSPKFLVQLREIRRGERPSDHSDEIGGEVMAIGRTQQESLQKALRGWKSVRLALTRKSASMTRKRYQNPPRTERCRRRAYLVHRRAFRAGLSVDGVFNLTNIDRCSWYKLKNWCVWKRK